MEIKHRDYLTYEIPDDWNIEEEEELISIYNPNGEGAMTLSFYTMLESYQNFVEQLSKMSTNFINEYGLNLKEKTVIDNTTQKDKIIIYNEGVTSDNLFVKIWIVAKYPKVVAISYISEEKTIEIETINRIVNSFKFKNLDVPKANNIIGKNNNMKIKHKDYLIYEIPDKWNVEEDKETILIYDKKEKGVIKVFFSDIEKTDETLVKYIDEKASEIIEENDIQLEGVLTINVSDKDKKIAYAKGKTKDNEFIKLWVIAKSTKVIIVEYRSNKNTKELKIVDDIVNSFKLDI